MNPTTPGNPESRRRLLLAGLALAASLVLSNCTLPPPPAAVAPAPAPVPQGPYLHVNDNILAGTDPYNSRIKIDLSEQRARLYNDRGELALETQISTGKTGYNTPTGTFSVLEKIVDKKSNRYGQWVYPGSGTVAVSDGDSRKPGPSGTVFRGTAMPYWMRVTWYGIGMHIGYVPDFAASHGCIRVPAQAQPILFSKTRVGTPISIVH